MMDVAVLAGGCSPEHPISLNSGRQVVAHLDHQRYRAWPVLLDQSGYWWVPDRPVNADQAAGAFVAKGQRLRPGAAMDYLLEQVQVQMVMPILHGPMGEDGTIQGMLELYGLPYTGSGCAASAVCMDKLRTRETLRYHSIAMPEAYMSPNALDQANPEHEARAIASTVGFPCFLKVDDSGSSLGVQRASNTEDVQRFLQECRGMGRRFLAEGQVAGEEITVAVLGNAGGPLQALTPVGIYPQQDDYFTNAAKYDPSVCEETAPPRGMSSVQIEEVQEIALRCHQILQCDGFSRTDMIISPLGPLVLEVNTIPGLTQASLLPKAAQADGLSLTALLDRFVQMALQRHGVQVPSLSADQSVDQSVDQSADKSVGQEAVQS